MKSLQFRLSVGFFLSLIGMFVLLNWMTSSSIRYLMDEHIISHIEHDAESIFMATNIDEKNRIRIETTQVEPVYLRPFSGQYYSIIAGDIIIGSPSLMGHILSAPDVATGEIHRDYQTGPKKQPLIVFARGYKKQGMQFTIILAEDLSSKLSKIGDFQYQFTVISLACLVMLIFIQVLILRSGFSPLKRIKNQIRELENGERTELDSNVPKEVSSLVCEVNRLIGVLNQRLQNSRNALGDLAHALKTPLTVLQHLSYEEVLQSQSEIRNTLETQTANMQQITDHVLKRARLAGKGLVVEEFNIEPELHDLANALKSIYRQKHLSINLNIPVSGGIPFDREDMLELLGNLMDNACKWADSTVHVNVLVTSKLQVIIEDDGPGVSDQFKPLLTKRGARLDESQMGYGLGLAIVKYIVDQYKGTIEFGTSTHLKGFRVEVNLPVMKAS